MARYRFIGFSPTDFPSLVIGRTLNPPDVDEGGVQDLSTADEFDLPDDVEVAHAFLDRLDGDVWVPTVPPLPETPGAAEEAAGPASEEVPEAAPKPRVRRGGDR